MGYVKWSYDTLNTFCHDVFRKFGFNEEETNIIKDVLLTADLYGIESHGMQRIDKIYDLADVYHCDNIDRVCEDFIEEAKIPDGTFDNVADCRYAIPSHWDIAKVYKRLIKQVAQEKQIGIVDALIKVYNSFLSAKIDDYNSSLYYENPSYLLECYLENTIL